MEIVRRQTSVQANVIKKDYFKHGAKAYKEESLKIKKTAIETVLTKLRSRNGEDQRTNLKPSLKKMIQFPNSMKNEFFLLPQFRCCTHRSSKSSSMLSILFSF